MFRHKLNWGRVVSMNLGHRNSSVWENNMLPWPTVKIVIVGDGYVCKIISNHKAVVHAIIHHIKDINRIE